MTGNQSTDDVDERCEYVSCDREATYRIRFTEPDTPTTVGYYCTEHKNTEAIHDPVNTTVERIDQGGEN